MGEADDTAGPQRPDEPPRDLEGEARDHIDTARDILGANTPGPTEDHQPPASEVGGESDPIGDELTAEAEALVERQGCGPLVLAGLGVAGLIAVILVLLLLNGGDDAPSPAVQGVSPTPVASAADATPGAATGADPPSTSDLPKDAVLFQGSSGGPIGCIACDGQHRFLSLDGPGVGVGMAASADHERLWDLDGQVLSFGARLGGENRGRYGVNLWVDGDYGPGVALEIGEQSAEYVWFPERDGPLRAGQRVAIIIGEAGTLDADGVPAAEGDDDLEWWFVFQPD